MNLFKKGASKIDNEEKPNFWISYADIMAGLLLMFILLLMIVMLDHRETLDQKTTQLKEKELNIKLQQEQIEQMLGVHEEIVQALQKEFEDSDLRLEIDEDSGAIVIPGEVFFEVNSSAVRESGVEDLNEFIPSYVDVLLSNNFRDYISEIIVEGHTDDQGSYMYNLELSQDRALEVIKIIYSDEFADFKNKNILRDYLTANGRSYSYPILNEDGSINRNKSRRVEFKFRLKDRDMIDEMKELLEGVN